MEEECLSTRLLLSRRKEEVSAQLFGWAQIAPLTNGPANGAHVEPALVGQMIEPEASCQGARLTRGSGHTVRECPDARPNGVGWRLTLAGYGLFRSWLSVKLPDASGSRTFKVVTAR